MKISEIFYSIQGEGQLAGTPSVFIRTAGCNRACPWCDTRYASRPEEYSALSVDAIIHKVRHYRATHFVLTGGEPMLADDIHELARRLHRLDKHITIETNATLAPDGIDCDLASLSPKLNLPDQPPPDINVIRDWLAYSNVQLKFVIASRQDLYDMRQLLDALPQTLPPEQVLLMPRGHSVEQMNQQTELLVQACKQFGYRYCRRLQLDLFGNQRGV
jgi:7-carboxy-7-deazaguanine synthase